MKSRVYWLLAWYLKSLAVLQLKKSKKMTVIGVTGSVGKTSCMMAIKAVLEDDFKVKISKKANSEVGIPLDILGFKVRSYGLVDWLWLLPVAAIKLLTNFEKYDVYVVEMGIDSPHPPKNMAWLLSIVKPKIGVFLNVFPVHTEPFEKLAGEPIDRILKEKGKLIESLPKDGWAILNKEDKRVASFANKTKARVVRVKRSDPKLMAIAVAKIFGIDKEKAEGKFNKNYKSPPGRMTIIKGVKNTTLIDSSYNSSKASVIMALKILDKSWLTRIILVSRKVVILGDMRELGSLAKEEHELVAKKTSHVADVVVVVGPLMKKYFVPQLLRSGFDKSNLFVFDNTYTASKEVREKIVQSGDYVLIKASQNTLLFEIIVEELMRDKKQAEVLLCRRGSFWDKKRADIRKKTGTI
jgi:UDP-N-acetylmuramoyl-tripeptide--D-alanyl-D-alanine ligase